MALPSCCPTGPSHRTPHPPSSKAECLSLEGVLAGRNLVYSAPTSGGKSLVAEALAVRRLLQTGRTALVVLPYRALCEQKVAHFDRVLGGRWPVKELYGQHGGLDIQGVGGCGWAMLAVQQAYAP